MWESLKQLLSSEAQTALAKLEALAKSEEGEIKFTQEDFYILAELARDPRFCDDSDFRDAYAKLALLIVDNPLRWQRPDVC
jgi:hypothetical protein